MPGFFYVDSYSMTDLIFLLLHFLSMYFIKEDRYKQAAQDTYDFTQGFPPQELENAWNAGDTAIVRKWIAGLKQDTLTDRNFFSMAEDLGSTTGLSFGYLETTGDFWKALPVEDKISYRYNVAAAFSLYENSCLFMDKRFPEYRSGDGLEEVYRLQDAYKPGQRSRFNAMQIEAFQKDLSIICMHIKKQATRK